MVTGIQIHPLVIHILCDAFLRRNETQERVIGTIMGNLTGSTASAKSCFTAIHSEQNGEIALDVQHHKLLLSLRSRLKTQEIVLGWFSTGRAISEVDLILQNYYAQICHVPVHLILSMDFSTPSHEIISAYISRKVVLCGRDLATTFVEIESDVLPETTKYVDFKCATSCDVGEPTSVSLEKNGRALSHLQAIVDRVLQYVGNVCGGNSKGDNRLGRMLSQVVNHSIGLLSRNDLTEASNEELWDSMAIMHLSRLVKAQIMISVSLGMDP